MDLDIGEMVALLVEMPLAVEMARHHALERAAKMLEAEAKREIGHYQTGIAPFADWAPLADSTVADKEAHGYAPPDNPLLRTGAMRDSIEHRVEGDEAYIGTHDEKAEFQELGTQHIPPRPFFGGALAKKGPALEQIFGDAVYGALTGQGVAGGEMPLLGEP